MAAMESQSSAGQKQRGYFHIAECEFIRYLGGSVNKFFAELKSYVRFTAEDEATLRALAPQLAHALGPAVDDFYDRILSHPGANQVLTGGSAQVERLKGTLREFLVTFFAGPWDAAYFEHRCQIGRRHVLVGLEQHYMVTALSGMRDRLCTEVVELSNAGTLAPPLTASLSAINKLCDIELAVMLHTYREDTLRKLQATERLATFGEMTSAICHELRNPLGVIESSNFLLRRREQDASKIEHFDRIQRQVRRSTLIITNMLNIVRELPMALGHAAPERLCERAQIMLQDERGVTAELHVDANLPHVMVDPDMVLQILGNLLNNAVDAIPAEGGRVRLSVSADQDVVRFVVEDNGPGIDEQVRTRLFEPLVTTKESGVGLGLALSRKLAHQLHGTLVLVRGELQGAAFALELPCSPR